MRSSNFSALRLAMTAGVLVASSALVAGAQQANASAAAAGMGGNFTARARGANAVAWNPALLGLAGNPGFSLQALALGAASGLDPVDISAFNDFAGTTIPRETREQWLQEVTAKGGEKGQGNLGLSLLGLSAGPIAFQLSLSGYGSANLSPDAFEALMFGNAGRDGTAKNLNIAGSSVRGGAFTTAAVSYGMSFGGSTTGSMPAATSSIGITGKYVVGSGLVMAGIGGSSSTAPNVSVNFPTVISNFDEGAASGSGLGVDLGYAWHSGATTFGATVQNVFNTFAWDDTKLEYRPGTATFTGENSSSDFDTQPYAQAPQALRDAITNNKFKPTIAVGMAYAWRDNMTITADAKQQLANDDAILIGPKTSVGAGIEARVIPMLPLRAGASYVTGGFALSGGVGLAIGRFELGVAGLLRNRDEGKEVGGMISLVTLR
jgi:hypothetical protein